MSATRDPASASTSEDAHRRSRSRRPRGPKHENTDRPLIVLVILFVIVLFGGCVAPPESVAGTGELTAQIVNQQGQPIPNTDVEVLQLDSDEVVFSGTTGPNGKIATNLEVGTYRVVADSTTETVRIRENETTETSLEVFRTPPKPTESAHLPFLKERLTAQQPW